MEYKFVGLCKEGKFDELKEMYQNNNINIHVDDDNAFRWSCYGGHINIAKWLYSLGDVNIHADNDEAFIFSCYRGHINIAQWLYSLGDINIHTDNDVAFRLSCYNSHINIAQWLYSLGGINVNVENDVIFKLCCNGKIELVKWLLLIGKFNNELVGNYLPEQYYDYAFSLGYLPTNKMIPFYVDYKNKIRNEIIEKYENGNISIFELSYLIDIIMVYI